MNYVDFLRLLTGISRCILCGELDKASLHSGICRSCRIRVEAKEFRSECGICHSCGIKLLSEKELCTECRRYDLSLKNRSLYAYRGEIKDLIQFYKFRKDKRLSRFFSSAIDSYLKKENFENWVLVPVPPARGKIYREGWDQMNLIARELKKKGWAVKKLLRKTGGISQKTLSREERLKKAEGRFIMKNKQSASDMKIMILDDVFTTGSTLRECYRTLRTAGADQIRSLTIARD